MTELMSSWRCWILTKVKWQQNLEGELHAEEHFPLVSSTALEQVAQESWGNSTLGRTVADLIYWWVCSQWELASGNPCQPTCVILSLVPLLSTPLLPSHLHFSSSLAFLRLD